MIYARPIAMTDARRPEGALPLARGWAWFDRAEVMERGAPSRIVPAADLPADLLERLTAPRAAIAGLAMDRPRIMGILNVTPDSFSDGGLFLGTGAAIQRAKSMAEAGADLIDVGGESTRPGAREVPLSAEIARTTPVLTELSMGGLAQPLSIDTRKAAVAKAAIRAGAKIVNDVSGLAFDPALAGVVAGAGVAVVVMHAQGLPETMQANPRYEDVLLDIYDALEERIGAAVAAGIQRERIVVDPGIGFGKTLEHNLVLLRGVSLFHGFGLPLLIGASRKRFIGTIAGEPVPDRRMPGSVAVALAAVAQGAQVVRVHDVGETKQALALWQAVHGGEA